MIKDILKFLWRRDSESAVCLAITLGPYLNDVELTCVNRIYRKVAQSGEHHWWNIEHLIVSTATIIWFWFQRSSETALWIAHCLTGYMTLKDVRQMSDCYTALVENRRCK